VTRNKNLEGKKQLKGPVIGKRKEIGSLNGGWPVKEESAESGIDTVFNEICKGKPNGLPQKF